MKNKGTIGLLGVTVALGLYVYFFEIEKPKKDESRKVEQSKLLTLKQDQVSQITIEKTGQPKIVVAKTADGWNVLEPLKDNADNTEVDDFLRSLSDEKYTDVANENADGQADLKIYGFDAPLGNVELKDQAGTVLKYTVGSRKNFEGNSFLQKAGEPRIIVASQLWPGRVDKKAIDFRDKRLMRASIGKVQKFQIKNPRGLLTMEQAENQWKLAGTNLVIDQNRAREVLTMLNESKVTEFIADHAPDAKQRAEFGFNQPVLTLTATVDGKSWEAVVGYGKDKAVYGWVKEPAFILKLDPPQLDKFKDLRVSFLREKRKAFEFDKAAVASAELKLKNLTAKTAPKTHPEFLKFLDNVASFEVSEYVDGLAKPKFENTLDLKNEKNEVLFSLAYGPTYENKTLLGDRKFLYAQTIVGGKASEIFLIDPTVANHVVDSEVFKEKSATTEKPPAEVKKPVGHP